MTADIPRLTDAELREVLAPHGVRFWARKRPGWYVGAQGYNERNGHMDGSSNRRWRCGIHARSVAGGSEAQWTAVMCLRA